MRQRLLALALVVVAAAILAVLYFALRPPASEIVLPALPNYSASMEAKADAPLARVEQPEPAPEPSPEAPADAPAMPADRTGMVIVPALPRTPKEKAPEPLPSALDVTLKGEVVDVAGRPVADAYVHVAGAVSADKYLRKGPSKLLARTGPDGKFEGKYSLQRGSIYDVTLYADFNRLKSEPIMVSVVPGDSYDGILIKMLQTGSITGCVVDMRQNPIPDAMVFGGPGLRGPDGKLELRIGMKAQFTANTDSGGRFTISDMPPGQYDMTATAFGFAASVVTATVRAGEITDLGFQLVLRPAIALKAQMECQGKQPRGRLVISFFNTEGSITTRFCDADQDGNVTIDSIPANATEVVFAMPGYLPTDRLPLPAPSDANVIDLGNVSLVASGGVSDKAD